MKLHKRDDLINETQFGSAEISIKVKGKIVYKSKIEKTILVELFDGIYDLNYPNKRKMVNGRIELTGLKTVTHDNEIMEK